MSYDDIALETEDKMMKALEVLQNDFKSVRTGRATPGLVDGVKVDYYGAPTPLKGLAAITVPEPRMIMVKPFDPGAIDGIVKAIQKADLGLNPQSDGKIVRLAIPPLSEERRKQMAKLVKEQGEKAKLAIRNVRRDANQQADAEEKDGTLTEDDRARTKEEIDRLTKEYEGKVQEAVDKKTKEVMEV